MKNLLLSYRFPYRAAAAALFLTGVLCLAGGAPAPAQSAASGTVEDATVTVVSCPLVEKWFTQDGIAFGKRTARGLGAAPITKTKLLILPLEAVGGPGAAKNVQDFVAKGGKLLAVYWGTLTAAEMKQSPTYHLVPTLGVKPIGWMPDPPQPLTIFSAGPALLPASGREVNLPGTPAVRLEALPGTVVIGRWTGENGSRPGAVFLRGNVLYIAANLLRPQNDRPEFRDTFFWAVQRLARDIGPGMQARDRIQQAIAAYASLATLMNASTPPEIRAEANVAQASLGDARSHLAAGRAARASFAADKARVTASAAVQRLKGLNP